MQPDIQQDKSAFYVGTKSDKLEEDIVCVSFNTFRWKLNIRYIVFVEAKMFAL